MSFFNYLAFGDGVYISRVPLNFVPALWGRFVKESRHFCVHHTFEPPHDKTNKMTVRPAQTQISLGISPAYSEDSDQTGRMPRLIWVFAARTVI